MSLLLLILIFSLKKIEADNDACISYSGSFKTYECTKCITGYNSVNCPDNDCVICCKCEITYYNECQ